MDFLIRSAVIINNNSPFHLEVKDIFIQDGIITKIGNQLDNPGHVKEVAHPNLHVSAGWFDLKANFCDPGNEQKEDILSGIQAAAAGGYTGILVMPSTNPPLQNKSSIEYVKGKGSGSAVDIYPAGALTLDRQGKDLCELYDMKQAGAIAFTDDKRPVQDAGVMLRALLYGRQVDSLIIAFASDDCIAGKAMVNESIHTTRLGLKGIPAMAEELIVSRDLYLCEYTGSRIHFSLISTAGAVNLIRKAKQRGLPVTADVSAYHLILDDSMLSSFDTNLKTKPPLRSRLDQEALFMAIADDTIDAIVSDHSPQDDENKRVEFDFAAYGMIGLETCFSVAFSVLENKMSLEKIISRFTNSRSLLRMEPVIIAEKTKANLTMFLPGTQWETNVSDILSKSRNTPFIGKKWNARVMGIFNNNQLVLNEGFR